MKLKNSMTEPKDQTNKKKRAKNVTEVSWSRKNNTQLTEITEHNETKEEEITRESSSQLRAQNKKV